MGKKLGEKHEKIKMNIWLGSWGIVRTTLAWIQMFDWKLDCGLLAWQLLPSPVQKIIIIAGSFGGNLKNVNYYSDRQKMFSK